MTKIFEVRESRTVTNVYHVEAETEEEARENYEADYKVYFEKTLDDGYDRFIEVEEDEDFFYASVETEEHEEEN